MCVYARARVCVYDTQTATLQKQLSDSEARADDAEARSQELARKAATMEEEAAQLRKALEDVGSGKKATTTPTANPAGMDDEVRRWQHTRSLSSSLVVVSSLPPS